MELSLRLDTLGLVEIHYLRTRDRYRDWPSFLLLAASRQARVLAYLSREAADQLHQQILAVEEAAGLGVDDEEDEDDEEEEENIGEELNGNESAKSSERETSSFSPAFAQTLERLNELARQRLPADVGSTPGSASSELEAENEIPTSEEEAALEQLQDAFVQMMEVVRELAEELSTDALKLTTRFRCVRTNIGFTQAEPDDDEDEDEEVSTIKRGATLETQNGGTHLELEVELALILQLYEEGRSRTDDLPAVELQLDVDDFEHLHETLDIALARDDRRSRRRR
jgi:hypothetical protein